MRTVQQNDHNGHVEVSGGQVLISVNEQRLDIHSVEISKTAKGELTFTVKSYGLTVDQAKQQACKIAEELEMWIQRQRGGER